MTRTMSIDSMRYKYRIVIGAGTRHTLGQFLPQRFSSVALISDANVYRLHGQEMGRLLEELGSLHTYVFEPGEESKNRRVKEEIEDAMLADGLSRDTVVVGLGGGVTTDLAGFVAGTFLRGVPWFAVPTSLLAAVDASVGGKVGVNTPAGKNLIGLFHHPLVVAIDLDFIATLPAEEFDNGLAEMAKHGLISDRSYFDQLVRGVESLRRLKPEALEAAIARSVEIKAEVVSKDPREADLRQILNGGHTIAHAIEKVSGFQISHGRAVAMGLSVEAGIAEKIGLLSEKEKTTLRRGLRILGLPYAPPAEMSAEQILGSTFGDKKSRGGRPHYALPEKIGKMAVSTSGYARPVPDEIVLAAIEETKACCV